MTSTQISNSKTVSDSIAHAGEAPVLASVPALLEPASAAGEGLRTLLAEAPPIVLTGERLLAAQALRLLIRLDRELREARAQWNQDWFRRLMHIRPKAIARLRRRWGRINPTPGLPLGSLRRRYHANLGRYLYHPRQ